MVEEEILFRNSLLPGNCPIDSSVEALTAQGLQVKVHASGYRMLMISCGFIP